MQANLPHKTFDSVVITVESGILTRVTRKTHLKESGRKINGRYKVRNNFAKRFKRTLQNFTDIKMCSTAHTELRCNEPNFSKVKSLFKLPDSLEETERDKTI
jgi:hypothetical protein